MTTNTNEVAIATPTEVFNDDNMRTVKITTLRNAPEGTQFFAELHDERGVFRKVLGSEFNTDKPLKAWEGAEGAAVLIEGRGPVLFTNHKFSGPKYPVTRIVNDKTGNERNVRVTFKVGMDVPTTATEHSIMTNTLPEETVEPELVVENEQPQMTKPVKSDYESFGDFMKACKQFKQWQLEQTELVTV